ncbi:MAG: hypothetical protein ABIH11_03740 [Candidatus Altiarchaeota archaeon]
MNNKAFIAVFILFTVSIAVIMLWDASDTVITYPDNIKQMTNGTRYYDELSATTSETFSHDPVIYKDDIHVDVVGCDSDYYGKTTVSVYVKNVGNKHIRSLTLATYLESDEERVVPGGEQRTEVKNLNPGVRKRYNVIYKWPPPWTKCRAEIIGENVF